MSPRLASHLAGYLRQVEPPGVVGHFAEAGNARNERRFRADLSGTKAN